MSHEWALEMPRHLFFSTLTQWSRTSWFKPQIVMTSKMESITNWCVSCLLIRFSNLDSTTPFMGLPLLVEKPDLDVVMQLILNKEVFSRNDSQCGIALLCWTMISETQVLISTLINEACWVLLGQSLSPPHPNLPLRIAARRKRRSGEGFKLLWDSIGEKGGEIYTSVNKLCCGTSAEENGDGICEPEGFLSCSNHKLVCDVRVQLRTVKASCFLSYFGFLVTVFLAPNFNIIFPSCSWLEQFCKSINSVDTASMASMVVSNIENEEISYQKPGLIMQFFTRSREVDWKQDILTHPLE